MVYSLTPDNFSAGAAETDILTAVLRVVRREKSEEWRWWFGAKVRRGMEREKSKGRGITDMAKSEKYRGPVVPSPGGSDTLKARNARGWAKHALVIYDQEFLAIRAIVR